MKQNRDRLSRNVQWGKSGHPKSHDPSGDPAHPRMPEGDFYSVILKAAARLLGAIVLAFAAYLLWRGHHAPGGGFIAALVAATAFALVVLAQGPQTVRRGLTLTPQQLIGVGLLLAMASGIPALVRGRSFLAGDWWPAPDPLVGTPVLFDLGVFLVVMGAILTVLLALEES